jgi:iron-sulfur cluster insertion protein
MIMVSSHVTNQHEDKQTWNVSITDSAAQRIIDLMEQEKQPNLMLRLTVVGGGCSGFQYNFSLEMSDTIDQNDVVFDYQGARIVIDHCSLTLVNGIEINFIDDLTGASFQVYNPKAVSSCGCGTSFAI